MPARKRTVGEASLLLKKYEDLNSDLPKTTRRQLAVFVLAQKVGKESLEELFGRPLGSAPFRHTSWMWYTAMRLSRMGHLWDEFVERRNTDTPMDACLYWLRDQVDDATWRLFSDRLGCVIFRDARLKPSDWSGSRPAKSVWTKGGVWSLRNNFTLILLLGEHLERDYTYNRLSKKLGPGGAARLERELRGTVQARDLLYPEAIRQAVVYARERIPQLADDVRNRKASYNTTSWFFQQPIPVSEGRVTDWTYSQSRRTTRRTYQYDWFPSEGGHE